MRSNTFDTISLISLFLVIVLLPVFFLPFTNIPIETSKGLLLVIGLAVSVISWSVARFFDGKIIIPKSSLLLGGVGVTLSVLLSALFSGTTSVSLFGTMFDVGTFWFIFAGFMLMLMSSLVFRERKNARILLLGIILSSAIVLIFQSARLFLPEILSLGVLSGKTGNILGSWNALGLFAGFSSLMSILVIEFFPTTKVVRWILKALILLGILLVASVNFPLVWVLIGLASLIIFVYKISLISSRKSQTEVSGEDNDKEQFPVFSFVIVMLSLLFFMSGQFIGGILPSRLGLSNTEIGPSLGATTLVTKGVLGNDPVFGIGPNKFGEAWALYKPASINQTQFWNVAFSSGSGLLPTFAATNGYLGILAWLIFFGFFLWDGVRSVFSSIKNNTNSEMMAFFVLSLYLFISAFFYSTGMVILLLALALAGVFAGLSSNRPNGEFVISFLSDPRKSFFSIMLLVLLTVVSAALAFKYVERFISVSYFGQALSAESIENAESAIGRALILNSNDVYLRTYAQIYLLKLNSLVAKGSELSEAEKAILQSSFDQAVNGAELAVAHNPKNYLNLQALGSIYQTVGSFGVADAYTRAIEAYKAASVLNPLNPGLRLAMASAAFADKKLADAKTYANEALTLKPDYIDALIVLSQISKTEGNNSEAISYAEQALALAPQDPSLIQYVNSLRGGGTTTPPATPSASESAQ